MAGPWHVDAAQFDGEKFATRYTLRSDLGMRDFWYEYSTDGLGYVHLAEGVVLVPPDDPPIFEAPG
ncbi:MAG TPA: hypothetical protein VJ044_06145 [Candidatus Hodarchaeales archaeon]|nr:hypothetical protein [Candidatus Hodarchaeales archaeon]